MRLEMATQSTRDNMFILHAILEYIKARCIFMVMLNYNKHFPKTPYIAC